MKRTEKTRDKLFNFRPIFFVAVFLCMGIVFAYAHTVHDVSVWWILLGFPFAAAPFCFCRSKKQLWKTACALVSVFVAFTVGEASFRLSLSEYCDCGQYEIETLVTGRVVEKTDYGGLCSVVLADVKIGKNTEDKKLNAYLPASFFENLRLSDEILLQGKVVTDTAYFDQYGFRATDIKKGICFFMTVTEEENCLVVGHEFDLFSEMLERIETVVYAGMDETSAAVTMAVLTGDTSSIETGLLDNIRMGGIAHIFAVSGLHVGALFAFCLMLVEKTRLKKLSRPLRFLLTALVVFFYAGICGFSASVVRAAVLCLIGYAAKSFGVTSDSLQALGAAAIVILLFAPTSLFEVGFQLSFAACLGIILLGRRISHALDALCSAGKKFVTKLFKLDKRPSPHPERRNDDDTHPPEIPERIRRAIVSFLSVTLAAQIATAPILLQTYGFLSGWSLLLNALFVPLISTVFSLLLLFVAIACILPTSAIVIVLYLPSVVWSALLLVFQTVDFSTFALTGITLSAGGELCYYGGWQFLSDKWNLSENAKIALSTLCFSAFAVIMVALNF